MNNARSPAAQAPAHPAGAAATGRFAAWLRSAKEWIEVPIAVAVFVFLASLMKPPEPLQGELPANAPEPAQVPAVIARADPVVMEQD